jgi:hypothetical protein
MEKISHFVSYYYFRAAMLQQSSAPKIGWLILPQDSSGSSSIIPTIDIQSLLFLEWNMDTQLIHNSCLALFKNI